MDRLDITGAKPRMGRKAIKGFLRAWKEILKSETRTKIYRWRVIIQRKQKSGTPVTTPASSKLIGVNLGVPTNNSIIPNEPVVNSSAKKYDL